MGISKGKKKSKVNGAGSGSEDSNDGLGKSSTLKTIRKKYGIRPSMRM